MAVALLVPDIRYKLKHWLKAAVTDDTGWQRSELQLDAGSYVVQLTSPTFEIDALYPSMTGPAEVHYFSLVDDRAPELIWLTGYSTVVTDEQNEQVLNEDYLCHNNLDYALADYCKFWGLEGREQRLNSRLATITQGQTNIQFPPGFGIAMMSNQSLSTATQVLNVNEPNLRTKVKHRVGLNYEIHGEKSDMKPLFQQSVNILVKVDTATNTMHDSAVVQDCQPALSTIAFLSTNVDGEMYTGHWVIPRGIDTLSYDVTNMLNLPFNTTLHYAGVHVHPYCEALELVDKTTGEVVFKSKIDNETDITKMTNIEAFSSEEGKMMFTDHEYELVCYTKNTTDREADMMAVMLLYLHDKELEAVLSNR